jgi:hypothetical protein
LLTISIPAFQPTSIHMAGSGRVCVENDISLAVGAFSDGWVRIKSFTTCDNNGGNAWR